MKTYLISLLVILTSCSQWVPEISKAVDDAVTDEACSVRVDKAAMQKDTNIDISLKISNKEPLK